VVLKIILDGLRTESRPTIFRGGPSVDIHLPPLVRGGLQRTCPRGTVTRAPAHQVTNKDSFLHANPCAAWAEFRSSTLLEKNVKHSLGKGTTKTTNRRGKRMGNGAPTKKTPTKKNPTFRKRNGKRNWAKNRKRS